MLELVNVTKVYKTKGVEVKALDNLSITFPSAGLLFISGKSGCGKTTLLNVIGGLDGIDEGEIFVQDKKFSDFSSTEYDAYRNTFIGFIFQDYNLLPEFTVEKNIKIAMELQGKQIDEKEFDKLLKDVGIEELKNRKISELSGGQRQRVAIARALVKQPRIIMADEPTGALDSATGEQVLDTLKKLSKDRLVIVVSHDREFAEKYADRIITLVDGKVAQDVSFEEKELQNSVVEREDGVLVREGAKLSEADKDAIAAAVYECKKVEIVKNLNYREKENTGTVVRDTTPVQALKKSKMKLRSAAMLGAKSLGVKPIRLLITILISALAFAGFGIFDTLVNFSTPNVLKNQLKNSLSETVVTAAEYVVDKQEGDSYEVKLSQAVIDDLSEETKGAVKGIYNLSNNLSGSVKQSLPISELFSSEVVVGKKYYANSINGFIEFDSEKEIASDGKFKDFDYTLSCGQYPELVYEDGVLVEDSMYQVAISTYLADSIIHYLNKAPLNGKQIVVYEDLLGATITINQQEYTITGLVDCGQIPAKYELLQKSTPYNQEIKALADDYDAYINSGAQKCLFMPNGFLKTYKQQHKAANTYYVGNASLSLSFEDKLAKKQAESYVFNAGDYTSENIVLFSEEYGKNGDVSLADNEILIHHLHLQDLLAAEITNIVEKSERDYVKDLIVGMDRRTAEENRVAMKEVISTLQLRFKENPLATTICQRFTTTGATKQKEAKIVGVYFGVDPENFTSASRYKLMMNKNLMQELEICSEQGDYSKALFSEKSTRSGVNVIADYLTKEEGFTLNWYNNSILMLIKENETIIRQIGDLFLYVALALALISVFMLYNYMSTSIASKKRSVGVLRALGASGKDILLTFLTESLIIATVNGILANVLAAVGANLVNTYVLKIMNISVQFALFGGRQICIIAIISLCTGILSSVLPIIKISKKKPVELIRRA